MDPTVGKALIPSCKARYAVLFQISMFPSRSGEKAHIGPIATYDIAICPGFPTCYHNITDTRIQHLIQSAYNCLKYNTTTEDTCLSTDYNQMPTGKEKNIDPHNHTGPGPSPGSPSLHVKRRSPYLLSTKNPEKSLGVVS